MAYIGTYYKVVIPPERDLCQFSTQDSKKDEYCGAHKGDELN